MGIKNKIKRNKIDFFIIFNPPYNSIIEQILSPGDILSKIIITQRRWG